MTTSHLSCAASPAHRSAEPGDEQRWADLADLILAISREVRFHGEGVRLTRPEGMVMRHLVHRGPAAPSRIAEATGLQRPNVSAALLRLQRQGLIRRETSADDGRSVIVRPTGRGHRAWRLIRRRWAATVAAAAGGDSAGLEEALALLTAIRDGMLRADPAAAA
jgi:DNA-binding MarR family transcriptional regulator